MSKETKILFSLVAGVSLLILVLGLVLTSKSMAPVLKQNEKASIEILGERSYDWGKININGGNVEKIFKIKNTGSADLEVTNFKTSCLCTEAEVIIDGKASPAFGMHTTSSWKGAIKPEQTADIKVVFNPIFHGPQGTGPITRLVSFNTNDSNNSNIEFTLTGNVVSLEK